MNNQGLREVALAYFIDGSHTKSVIRVGEQAVSDKLKCHLSQSSLEGKSSAIALVYLVTNDVNTTIKRRGKPLDPDFI